VSFAGQKPLQHAEVRHNHRKHVGEIMNNSARKLADAFHSLGFEKLLERLFRLSGPLFNLALQVNIQKAQPLLALSQRFQDSAAFGDVCFGGHSGDDLTFRVEDGSGVAEEETPLARPSMLALYELVANSFSCSKRASALNPYSALKRRHLLAGRQRVFGMSSIDSGTNPRRNEAARAARAGNRNPLKKRAC
jgi:hypothetical protein